MWHLEKIIEMNKKPVQNKEIDDKQEEETLLKIKEELAKSKELLVELRSLVEGLRLDLKG